MGSITERDQRIYSRRELEVAMQTYSALRTPCRTVANYEAQYGGKHDWTDLVAFKCDLDEALDSLGKAGIWHLVSKTDGTILKELGRLSVQQVCVVAWYIAPYKLPVDGCREVTRNEERMRRLGEVIDWLEGERGIRDAQHMMRNAFFDLKRFLNNKRTQRGAPVKPF